MRLGQHELLIRLASGGAANVFLVRDRSQPGKDRLLALKILLPALAQNEDFINMFFAEAQIASRLQHPNVVTIAGFGQVEGIFCLAMEYVFGASLSQVLRASARAKKPLTVGVLLRIAAQVCDALHYAHELRDENNKPLKLVHRDVTPQNILIGFNGVPKLTDFGIAKATNRGWETQAGIVKGKFSYMSPEQALGKRVDRRSDIFGAGIVLWEALTGRDLFKGSTPLEVLTAIRQHKIRPPSKVVPGLTPIVDPIVMKALKRSPRGRYQTAAEMRDDIEALIQRAGVQIDAQTISHEFAAIYGDEIVERAFALRAAMAGKGDLQNLAAVLGGSVLEEKHLPVLTGGPSNPDPLSLFIKDTPDLPRDGGAASALPARMDRSYSGAHAVLEASSVDISDDTADDNEEYPPFELDDPLKSIDLSLPEEVVKNWNEGPSRSVPVDDLLNMISERDAAEGYLPEAFAERFGQELKNLPELPAPVPQDFDDEMTVGWSGDGRGPRVISSSPRQTGAMASAHPLRGVPRAPSLDMESRADQASAEPRPFGKSPRAPSLDLDSTPDEGGVQPSRPPLATPPPPPSDQEYISSGRLGLRPSSGGREKTPSLSSPAPGNPSTSLDIAPSNTGDLSSEALRALARNGESSDPQSYEAAMPNRPAQILVAPWVLVAGAAFCMGVGLVLGLILSGG